MSRALRFASLIVCSTFFFTPGHADSTASAVLESTTGVHPLHLSGELPPLRPAAKLNDPILNKDYTSVGETHTSIDDDTRGLMIGEDDEKAVAWKPILKNKGN